jgi:D-glycero-alpha-D-manno-heptose 1-phosphate guanylyltransferase
VILEAIILAGGFGTRLQSVVKDIPKPMADIGGKPFLEYLICYLSKCGVDKVILSVGYKKEAIKEYFKDSFEAVKIVYCDEDSPLKTGGAIKKALSFSCDEDVLVVNGDTFFALDIRTFKEAHIASKSLVSLSLKPMMDFDRYGSVVLNGSRVCSFEEKSYRAEGLINGGVYMLNRSTMLLLNDYSDIFSFEKDFLEEKIADINPHGFIDNGYFIDIGIPEDYERAKKELNDYI